MEAIVRTLLFVTGAALVVNAGLALVYRSMNLGTVMPFVIGLPLIILALFWRPIHACAANSGFIRFLLGAMAVVYVLFIILFAVTTCLILVNSKTPEDKEPDAVIVLGAGIKGSRPTVQLVYRLQKAAEYYEKNPELLIVVSGGQGPGEQYTEAEIMRNWLIAHGIPDSSIIVEDRATSTEENFLYSMELINFALPHSDGGSPSVGFITNRFHVFRAERLAKKLGVNCFGIAAKDYMKFILNDYLRECAAIVQHFFRGKI